MVTHDDLVRLWGEAGIARASLPIKGVKLPSGALDVLAGVGLPIKVEPLFEARPLMMIVVPGREGEYCRFGSDFGSDMCISPVTGEIFSFSETGEHLGRFVNSNLASFVEFMAMVFAERIQFPNLDDGDIDHRIEVLAERLGLLDSRAFVDPDNWWSVILEQMRDGLL